jgi:hypothetical protein
MKSVTIAVEYSSPTAEQNRDSMLLYDPNWLPSNSRAWKASEEESSLCQGFMSPTLHALAGSKCAASNGKTPGVNHTEMCFTNLFKNMEQIDAKTALTRVQTLLLDQLHADLTKSADGLNIEETTLELELWISYLLESRYLQRFCTPRSDGSVISYNRTEILDLDSTIGKLSSSPSSPTNSTSR